MQTKLHRGTVVDPGRRFDDVFNLVADPAFLMAAWDRVRGNKVAAPRELTVSRRDLFPPAMLLRCSPIYAAWCRPHE